MLLNITNIFHMSTKRIDPYMSSHGNQNLFILYNCALSVQQKKRLRETNQYARPALSSWPTLRVHPYYGTHRGGCRPQLLLIELSLNHTFSEIFFYDLFFETKFRQNGYCIFTQAGCRRAQFWPAGTHLECSRGEHEFIFC